MKLTNFSPAARGVGLKDGTTVWLEPGQSETFDKAQVVEPLPDLGRKQDEVIDNGDDKARIAELEALVAELEAKLAAATKPSGEPGPLDQSVEKLTEHLQTMTDADEIEKLIAAETAGKSRAGALAALKARQDELLA